MGRHAARGSEPVTTGQASLLHGSAGQGGKSDDVAGGINVRHGGLKMLVDLQFAAPVRRQARRLEIEQIAVGLPPDGVQQPLAVDVFSAFELGKHAVPGLVEPD